MIDSIKFPGGLRHARKRRIVASIGTAIVGLELTFRLVSGFFAPLDLLGLGLIGSNIGWMIGPLKVRWILGIILMYTSFWILNRNKSF